MLKKLIAASMLGVSLIIGSIVPASAADVWVYSGAGRYSDHQTDTYVDTNSIRWFGYNETCWVKTKIVDYEKKKIIGERKYKFFKGIDATEWTYTMHAGNVDWNDKSWQSHAVMKLDWMAQKILDICWPYRKTSFDN